ncbi:MAG: adenylosuccinate lyase [Chloroflexi bacterium]|nr:adenylosuccinate lyase [Chloroflexota bacterium]
MSLKAISPLDGRYRTQAAALADYFSEYALIRYRVLVEIRWLITLADQPDLPEIRPLTPAERRTLESWIADFSEADAARVKEIEQTTQHDVKAVEYYLRERLAATSLADLQPFVHFACTSEDINNLAYGLALKEGIGRVWRPAAERLIAGVAALAERTRTVPMLARTHGQPATPTTLGKELAVFVARWRRQLDQIDRQEYRGKLNGAVGAYNAHLIAYPTVDWPALARAFVESLGLVFSPLTTQIEPHDYLAELFHALARFNTIGIDFCRDVWSYISMDYFRQRAAAGEVGSSTMPHKVNPIHFENAEGNFGLSTALLEHLAGKLPISRLQRDLTDSTVLRSIGTAIGHSLVALRAATRGLERLEVNEGALQRDLEGAWSVLAEAVQTVMRKAGYRDAYERLAALTRGQTVTAEDVRRFVASLDLPDADRTRLLALTPAAYTGLAARLVDEIQRTD